MMTSGPLPAGVHALVTRLSKQGSRKTVWKAIFHKEMTRCLVPSLRAPSWKHWDVSLGECVGSHRGSCGSSTVESGRFSHRGVGAIIGGCSGSDLGELEKNRRSRNNLIVIYSFAIWKFLKGLDVNETWREWKGLKETYLIGYFMQDLDANYHGLNPVAHVYPSGDLTTRITQMTWFGSFAWKRTCFRIIEMSLTIGLSIVWDNYGKL